MSVNLLQKRLCEMTEKEFNSLPGFGAAQILNGLAGEIILDVAKYRKNMVIVFICTDGKSDFWQPYFVRFVDEQPLENAVDVHTISQQVKNSAVSL